MNLTLEPILEYNLPGLADILNQCFANYLVPVNVEAPALAQIVRQEGIDLAASRFVLEDETIAGIALLGRRGWTSRLAAMGVKAAGRRRGIGRWFMEQLVAEARGRGERTMILEVIEQNEAALRLYHGAGFRPRRRLVGYTADRFKGIADSQLQEVDLREAARQVICYGLPDLPWQISGETLAQLGLPARGYRLGPAYAVISDPEQENISLRALVVPEKAQPQVWLLRLMQALIAKYPAKTWKVPILYPEELAPGLFESLGFEREQLTQLQMKLELGS